MIHQTVPRAWLCGKAPICLAQHIKNYHKNIKSARLKLTGLARVWGRIPKLQLPRGQKVCLQDTLFRVELDKEQQPPKAAALQEPSKGTRSDPRFDLEHPEMKRFTAYLQSYDGETKQEQEARSITTDVSKFLKYASPDKVNWLAVTDPIKVRIPGEHGTKVGCRHRRQTDQYYVYQSYSHTSAKSCNPTTGSSFIGAN